MSKRNDPNDFQENHLESTSRNQEHDTLVQEEISVNRLEQFNTKKNDKKPSSQESDISRSRTTVYSSMCNGHEPSESNQNVDESPRKQRRRNRNKKRRGDTAAENRSQVTSESQENSAMIKSKSKRRRKKNRKQFVTDQEGSTGIGARSGPTSASSSSSSNKSTVISSDSIEPSSVDASPREMVTVEEFQQRCTGVSLNGGELLTGLEDQGGEQVTEKKSSEDDGGFNPNVESLNLDDKQATEKLSGLFHLNPDLTAEDKSYKICINNPLYLTTSEVLYSKDIDTKIIEEPILQIENLKSPSQYYTEISNNVPTCEPQSISLQSDRSEKEIFSVIIPHAETENLPNTTKSPLHDKGLIYLLESEVSANTRERNMESIFSDSSKPDEVYPIISQKSFTNLLNCTAINMADTPEEGSHRSKSSEMVSSESTVNVEQVIEVISLSNENLNLQSLNDSQLNESPFDEENSSSNKSISGSNEIVMPVIMEEINFYDVVGEVTSFIPKDISINDLGKREIECGDVIDLGAQVKDNVTVVGSVEHCVANIHSISLNDKYMLEKNKTDNNSCYVGDQAKKEICNRMIVDGAGEFALASILQDNILTASDSLDHHKHRTIIRNRQRSFPETKLSKQKTRGKPYDLRGRKEGSVSDVSSPSLCKVNSTSQENIDEYEDDASDNMICRKSEDGSLDSNDGIPTHPVHHIRQNINNVDEINEKYLSQNQIDSQLHYTSAKPVEKLNSIPNSSFCSSMYLCGNKLESSENERDKENSKSDVSEIFDSQSINVSTSLLSEVEQKSLNLSEDEIFLEKEISIANEYSSDNVCPTVVVEVVDNDKRQVHHQSGDCGSDLSECELLPAGDKLEPFDGDLSENWDKPPSEEALLKEDLVSEGGTPPGAGDGEEVSLVSSSCGLNRVTGNTALVSRRPTAAHMEEIFQFCNNNNRSLEDTMEDNSDTIEQKLTTTSRGNSSEEEIEVIFLNSFDDEESVEGDIMMSDKPKHTESNVVLKKRKKVIKDRQVAETISRVFWTNVGLVKEPVQSGIFSLAEPPAELRPTMTLMTDSQLTSYLRSGSVDEEAATPDHPPKPPPLGESPNAAGDPRIILDNTTGTTPTTTTSTPKVKKKNIFKRIVTPLARVFKKKNRVH